MMFPIYFLNNVPTHGSIEASSERRTACATSAVAESRELDLVSEYHAAFLSRESSSEHVSERLISPPYRSLQIHQHTKHL